MKEYYKIGEISDLYGIGTDSLRYYEEIGILKPKRDDNGYRMYSISDIRTLNILRELRSIGFSMKEIKEHLTSFNLNKTLSMFEQEIDRIDQKVEELSRLRQQLTGRIDEIHYHMNTADHQEDICLRPFPERKILQLAEQVYRDVDLDFVIKKLQKENEEQLYLIGNGNMGATIPLNYIRTGSYGHFNSVFFIMEDGDEYDGIIPAGDYLCLTVNGSYSLVPDRWKDFFAEAEKQNLSPLGDPMEIYIIDNHDTSDETEYVTQLQMQVERN